MKGRAGRGEVRGNANIDFTVWSESWKLMTNKCLFKCKTWKKSFFFPLFFWRSGNTKSTIRKALIPLKNSFGGEFSAFSRFHFWKERCLASCTCGNGSGDFDPLENGSVSHSAPIQCQALAAEQQCWNVVCWNREGWLLLWGFSLLFLYFCDLNLSFWTARTSSAVFI